MDSFTDENIIDVEYEHTDNKVVRGEPLFFTSSQCAEMVGVEVSTIRFWSKRFEHLLDVQISNKNKQYKKSDIEKLKFIKKLAKDDGLTLQQIDEYTTSKGFDINDIEKGIVDSSNPLAIQTFISAVTVELEKKFETFAEDLLNKINESHKINFVMQQELNDKLTETIAITVDELVSEKLDTKLDEFKAYIDTQEQQAKQRDVELLDSLKTALQDQKSLLEQNTSQNQQSKQSFFSKIFKR